ncbi:MAG: DNA polymerase III subunit alpha [Bacteroidetes bacterium]|nr:MAG: DNA polymerase III subunit alpha [Bacteroidota bacterium]
MFLVFDTETTGLPKDFKAPITDTDNWPRVVQIAWQLHGAKGELIEQVEYLIKPDGFDIPFESEQIHGISTALAERDGVPLREAMEHFVRTLKVSKFNVGQNVGFDINVVGCELYRLGLDSPMLEMPVLDTCTEVTAQLCQIPGGRGGKFKLPTLTELHQHLFGEAFGEAHNATADVEATTRCFLELIRTGVFKREQLGFDDTMVRDFVQANPDVIQTIGLKHRNLKKQSEAIRKAEQKEAGIAISDEAIDENLDRLSEVKFAHLHNHTQFSILQAVTDIRSLVNRAGKEGMPAVAMTDLGNLMGAFHFVKAVGDYNKSVAQGAKDAEAKGEPFDQVPMKAVVGCEFFVCGDRLNKSVKDNGFQIPMLAKNKAGYLNMAKMSSEGFINGFYYVPRIDKDLIVQHKENVMVTTGGLQGEVPQLILNVGEKQAEEAFVWWHEQFGDDFYVELNRHNLPEEDRVNEVLLRFAKQYGVKCIAANNTFYLDKKDAEAHDILLCVKEGEKKSTPIGRGRGYRYGFPNDEFYFKSQDEMKKLFADIPEAIENISEILDKVEPFELARDVLLPAFDIPEQFQDPQDEVDGGKRGENAFLRHLTYEGAARRYDEITDEIRERLDFELETIANTGYPGYFLIVQDFCNAARDMGVSVGPGRGSAAGSAVAYCIGITNVDPIAYDLLFERFLNPERVSLPDIDIDFDDRGREKVIQYVIDKYGSSQVAQIITYGTMAAKSSIKDTARVLDLPFDVADRLTKMMPDTTLNKLMAMDEKTMKSKFRAEDLDKANSMVQAFQKTDIEGITLKQAHTLEGSVRSTGIHACGVIITPSDIRELVPVSLAKDSDMWCTQFDNSVVESAGLLKMDFLGLKTLTLIKDAVVMVKENHGVDLDMEAIPIDDRKTYELFQRGETVGVFQYESAGMQKYLKDLKPTVFADLIAMNALYRPGPLEYIPSFVRRKHGIEEITYDLDDMQEYLEETYGITVYQEQVMLLSQKLAGFTKGEADTLRKAMGKKIFALLETLKPKFINGGKDRGHDEDKLNKVWKDWEAFASYAFNKSHSTCYAWVAYQTAYLKAHYPAEYMASVLSNNMNDIKQVTFFMEECRRMHIPVLLPDVNESSYVFTVNDEGAIRFGLGGMRGVGGNAVDHLVAERKKNGEYKGIFDFLKRVDLRIVNRKTIESLALGGAFDSFENEHRAIYFADEMGDGRSFLERAIKYAQNVKASEESAQVSLFGESSEVQIPEPPLPDVEKWSRIQQLNREKEVNGMYLSSHPLDDFRYEINAFCSHNVEAFVDERALVGREIHVAGIVTDVQHRVSKNGKEFGFFTLEDLRGSHEFRLFGEPYLRFKHFLVTNQMIYMKAKVSKRSWEKDGEVIERINVDIFDMKLLQEIMEELSKSLDVSLRLDELDEYLMDKIEAALTRHPGKKKVAFHVIDSTENIAVKLPSRTRRVEISKELLDQLQEIDELQVKLN